MAGLQMKYFVLKPSGNSKHAAASRKAMRVYAMMIRDENFELAKELMEWADSEMKKTDACKKNVLKTGR
jgi:hypothetical protein